MSFVIIAFWGIFSVVVLAVSAVLAHHFLPIHGECQ